MSKVEIELVRIITNCFVGEAYAGGTDKALDQITTLLKVEVAKAKLEARMAELWNPGLRIPENESVIRERTAKLKSELAEVESDG